MSSGRYYFPEIVGNDHLSYIAQFSKSTLEEGEKIIKIFQTNHNLLYGKSPSQNSFLMKQNNQSIFYPSPNRLAIRDHKKDSVRKVSECMSTPIKRYPNLPGKYKSADETKSDLPEMKAIFIRQRRIFSLKDAYKMTENQPVDETENRDQDLVSITPSKSIGNSDEGNKNNLCLVPITDENTATVETFINPKKVEWVHNLVLEDQESCYSTREMHDNLNADDHKPEISLKANITPDIFEANVENSYNSGKSTEKPYNENLSMQEPGEFSEERSEINHLTKDEMYTTIAVQQEKLTCDQGSANPDKTAGIINPDKDLHELAESLENPKLKVDETHTSNSIAKISCDIVAKSKVQASVSLEEKVGIAVNPDEVYKITDGSLRDTYTTKQDSYKIHDERSENPNLTADEENTPSPVKQARIICNYALESEIQASVSSDEQVEIAVNPHKVYKMTDGSLRDTYTTKQDSYKIHGESSENPNLTSDEENTPSPVKQARIICDYAEESEIQVSSSAAENFDISVNPDDTKMTFRGNKENISPGGKSKNVATSEEKRKSPCQRRNTLSLRGIPRMVRFDGVEELDVSLSCESEESPSPKVSRIPLRTCRLGKKREKESGDKSAAKDSFPSDLSDEPKVERVPKIIIRRTYSASGDESYSSHNVSESTSPKGDKSCIPRKTISPSARASKSVSPISRDYLTSGSRNRTSISPKTFLKPKSPQVDEHSTPENNMSSSTKISPAVPKYGLRSSERMSCKNTSGSVTGTNSPTEVGDNVPLKTISPPTGSFKSIKSPKSHEHRISPPIGSPCKFLKPESPMNKIGYNLSKRISPSTKISPKISESQLSPSDKKSCINPSEDFNETRSQTGDADYLRHLEMMVEKKSSSPRLSQSLISPNADKYRNALSGKISCVSPNSSSKLENPKTTIDCTARKRISPSTKISPTVSRFSPQDKMSCINIPESVTETSSPTGDKDYITRKKISPITLESHEHRISHLEKISIDSPNSSCKIESPKTNIDYTQRKKCAKISTKISKCQFSPSDQRSCLNTSEGVIETNALTGNKSRVARKEISPSIKDSESLISPKDRENQNTPLEKKSSVKSPIKQESPKTNIVYNFRKRKSPSKIPQEISKCKLSPSDKKTCEAISETESGSNSLGKGGICIPIPLLPPVSSLKTETSLKDEIYDSDSTVLDWYRKKLTELITKRDECMKEIFGSFSELQRDLNFLFFYFKKMSHIIEKLSTVEGYSNNELCSLIADLRAKALDLVEKYNLWKTAGDAEVQVWIQCFEEIRKIISRNGTSNPSRGEYISFLKSYETDLRCVWKRMDNMHIQEEARRSLFQNTSRDFERFMKLFIKCLIIIGVIKHRDET